MSKASPRSQSSGRSSGESRQSSRASREAFGLSTQACESLLAYVAPSEPDDERALAIANEVARRHLGDGWTVRPLGPGARDYQMVPPGRRRISTRRGWELTNKVREDRDVASAEPDLIIPGLEPDPTVVDEVLLPHERRVTARREADEAPLPCATAPDWSLALCRVRDGWALTPPDGGQRFGAGIIVGHPDTGYTKHAEIWSANPVHNRLLIDRGRDFFGNAADPVDTLTGNNPGHGTTTASVIMSDAPDGATSPFVAGVAPMAQLVPLRVTDTVVIFTWGRLAEAIRYAADQGFHVISMSLGGPFRSGTLDRAIDHAVSKGVILLAAAGNVWPFVVYPARFDQIIAVAACNCQRGIWRSSASGDTVDVTAPGESVWVARPGGTAAPGDDEVRPGSGTSYAVATAAGACALWLAYHGRDALVARYGAGQLASVFKELLMNAGVTTPAGWQSNRHGAGILDVLRLLQASLPPTPPAAGLRVRATAAPRTTGEVEEFFVYFPDRDPSEVRRGLARLLHTSERDLPVVLARHGDELLFHVATNPAVRLAIAGPRGRIDARATATASARVAATSSRGLKSRMAGARAADRATRNGRRASTSKRKTRSSRAAS
jgi:serine protease